MAESNMRMTIRGAFPLVVKCPVCHTDIDVPQPQHDESFIHTLLTCTCGKTIYLDSRK